MSKMDQKNTTYRNQSTFALSKKTFGHVSNCFVVFPSVEIQACLVKKHSAPCLSLIKQKYANHERKT